MRGSRLRRLLIAACAALAACSTAHAQQVAVEGETAQPAPPAEATEPAPPEAPAGPPQPVTDDHDWLQFKNGEWLKGELKDVQDGNVVFDSDELDTLNLDLDDIHAIYTSRPTTIMLRDRSLLEGELQVEADEVIVVTALGPVTLTRGQVRSVIPGEPSEWNYWSGRIGAGATVRRGNVDQTDLSATFRLERRDPGTRLSFAYDGAYSLLRDQRTANNHQASATFDVYLTERLFVRPAGIVYFRDEFQNIDYRITPSGGFGYEIIDDDRLTWTAGAGFGWQFERFIQAPPGGDRENDSAAFLANTSLDWEATPKIDVGFEFDLTVPTDDAAAFNFRATTYAEIEVWDDFDLDVKLIWDRNNDPTAESDGAIPEKDDVRLVIGVSLEF